MHCFRQLYYHFIWATHCREAMISRSWRPQFLTILNEEAKNRGGRPLRHNAMLDHAHLLVRLPPTVLISDFIGQVKGATAYRVNREIAPAHKLIWKEGYGVLSIRRDKADKVARYVDRQEQHHRRGRVSDLLEQITIETDETWHASHPLEST